MMMTTRAHRASADRRPSVRVIGEPHQVRSALSPLRRRLLVELREPGSASGLSPRLGVSRQKLNYHLRKLEEQGLVQLVSERPRRGFTERIFQTSARALVVDPEVLGDIGDDAAEMQDRLSSAYMVAAASRLLNDVAALRSGATAADQRLLTVTEETEIHFESPRELRGFIDELTGALARLAAKYHRAETSESRPYRLLFALHPRREVDLSDPRATEETMS